MTTTILDRVRAHVHRAPPRRPPTLRLVSSPTVSSPVVGTVSPASPPTRGVMVPSSAGETLRPTRPPTGRTPEHDAAIRAVIAPPTLAERILVCAAALPQPFSRADLIVAAFHRWPETFALAGYPHLPSSNNVDPVVVKLVQRGLLERVDGNLRVTHRGMQRARRIAEALA